MSGSGNVAQKVDTTHSTHKDLLAVLVGVVDKRVVPVIQVGLRVPQGRLRLRARGAAVR